jgi:hypothetical protein
LPSAWFGSNSSLVGNPAIDFQVAGEQQYSNTIKKEYTVFFVGVAFKTGFRFGI